MARTALPYEATSYNTAISGPTGTTLEVGNDGYVINAAECEKTFLRIAFTGATGTMTIKAGDLPPALGAGKGDLAVVGYNTTKFVGPFESERFLQADGTVNIDFSGAAATGTLTNFKIRRSG